MNVLGISAFFHDAACCLLQNGILVAAAEEERFTRIKADPAIPRNAFSYCLQAGNISLADIDCVAYYEDPYKKLGRQLWSGVLRHSGELLDAIADNKVERQIREVLGYEGPIKYSDHHRSHAASSFFFSGYSQAAIFTVDGVGEWATTTYGAGGQKGIEIFEQVEFPDSLGLFYSTITSYLGFGVNDGEYKVMGLAPYGKPLYTDKMGRLLRSGKKGQYSLDMEYFSFLRGNRMYGHKLIELLGAPPRKEDDPILQFHMDVARSAQVILEEILMEKVNYLYEKTGHSNLCMAGGVALNCVANGKIMKNGPFKKLFVQPAANDAGAALGAAALAHMELTGERPAQEPLAHVYLGPSYPSSAVSALLQSAGVRYHSYPHNPDALLQSTVERLAKGKVIGWFQGRMEFGPRSLGARSILADPRNEEMRDRINAMVKKREGFRPFAPAICETRARDYFDIDHPSPFMLETCQVKPGYALPAITHVDGSARLQTVSRHSNQRFFDLLTAFEKLTGCPVLLNTSFNIKGEPIVCSPEDALKCFIGTDIDCLVMEDFLIDRNENNFEIFQLLFTHAQTIEHSGITHDVYTFV